MDEAAWLSREKQVANDIQAELERLLSDTRDILDPKVPLNIISPWNRPILLNVTRDGEVTLMSLAPAERVYCIHVEDFGIIPGSTKSEADIIIYPDGRAEIEYAVKLAPQVDYFDLTLDVEV